MKGKLAPRYIGPFEVIARRGHVAYQLRLPTELSDVHDVFHVSQLRKCLELPDKPDVLKEAEEQVQLIRECLKTAQSRQKSYADPKRREVTFSVGDFVYL